MMTEKALTLEQLQKMRGKWVWIVSPDKDLTVSGWAYVGKDHVYTYWEYERDELVGRVVYNICDYGAWLAYKNPTAINLEALPVVQQLREELARVTEERNAAIKVIQRRAGCFECTVLERKECSTPLYDHCGKWQWRGMQKDRQKLEPLTPAQVKVMDYDKVWIDYGGDGEWGIVVDGLLYSISTLEGAGFVDMLQDAVRGEDVERPSGSYQLYRTQRIYEEENHAEAD